MGPEEAVEAVLAEHPGLDAARAALDAARAQEARARSAYRPQVIGDAGYAFQGPLAELEVDPGIPGVEPIREELGSLHSGSVELSLGYRLFDFGARRRQVEAAHSGVAVAEQSLEELRVELAFQARSLVLGYLLARDVAAIAAQSLTNAEERARRAELRFAEGMSSELEVVRARVRVAELRSQQVAAQQRAAQLRGRLAVLLGREPDQPPELEGSLEELAEEPPFARFDPEAHPTVRRLRSAEQARRRQAEALARTRWPSIDLGLAAGAQYPLFIERRWSEVYRAGVQARWSIYTGGGLQAQIRSARAEADRLAALARRAIRELEDRHVQVQAHYRTALAAEAAGRETMERAEAYLRAAQASFEAGVGTDMDVRDAELALDAARLEVQQALFERALARAEWLAVAGRTADLIPAGEEEAR
jgi:outer membrane protein TolC